MCLYPRTRHQSSLRTSCSDIENWKLKVMIVQWSSSKIIKSCINCSMNSVRMKQVDFYAPQSLVHCLCSEIALDTKFRGAASDQVNCAEWSQPKIISRMPKIIFWVRVDVLKIPCSQDTAAWSPLVIAALWNSLLTTKVEIAFILRCHWLQGVVWSGSY